MSRLRYVGCRIVNKNGEIPVVLSPRTSVLVSSVLLVALSAVDRFTRRRHEWYFCVCAAFRAFDFRHLPWGTVTSILITHFVFHLPNFLVIQKIVPATFGTGQPALPSSRT